MADENKQISNNYGESNIAGFSARSIIAILLVLNVCLLALFSIPIPPVISDLTVGICSFYFGHIVGKTQQ